MHDTVHAVAAMLDQLTVPLIISGGVCAIWLITGPLTQWFIRKNGPLSRM